jgi:hypothetical protein
MCSLFSCCIHNSLCTNTIGNYSCQCEAAYPGGNPPTESCRKYIAGEICPGPSNSSLCDTGLECASKSRREQITFACCVPVRDILYESGMCNGAYGEGEECFAGTNDDCKDGLQCVREGVMHYRWICCRSPFPLFGNFCFLFVPGWWPRN